ncbi:hypothetical protein E2C01_067952 [Portunus trituberculatus]|uniref:Uncharacterized protein n=1 Tax=Portunus trituberculatus TaxID=210409 RepID=A0A5B7HWL5_PORTR|nr:hypothetical protein [Portunus trituberculatus]
MLDSSYQSVNPTRVGSKLIHSGGSITTNKPKDVHRLSQAPQHEPPVVHSPAHFTLEPLYSSGLEQTSERRQPQPGTEI